MSNFRFLDRTITCKQETTAGTDATPVVGTDAVLVEEPNKDDELQLLQTNEVTGSLDPRAPVVGGGPGTFGCRINMHGSGTAATAPEWRDFLMACGFAETVTGTAVDDTAQAGAAGTITLHSGASASNDAYNGMVIVTNGGTGSGQTRVITDYVGSTKVASVYPDWDTNPDSTTDFIIYANVRYVPASTSLLPSTIYDYAHRNTGNSLLRKVLGWMGAVDWNLPAGGIPQMNYAGRGIFVTPADVSDPGAATYQSTRPIALLGAASYLDGVSVAFNTLSLSGGISVAQNGDPRETYGLSPSQIARRQPGGRINPPRELAATRDVFTDLLAGTAVQYWLQWGSTAGNRFSILLPQMLYAGSKDENINNLMHEGIPFSLQGEDTWMYLCCY